MSLFGGLGGGIDFTGGSSSKSYNTVAQPITNVDRRQAVAEGGIGVTSDSATVTTNVNVLDGGSIAAAFDLAKTSLGFAKEQEVAGQGVLKQSADAVAAAYSQARGDSTLKWAVAAGIAALVGIVAVVGLRERKKA